MIRYLLKTPGRTASHIILSYFTQNNYSYDYTFKKDAKKVFDSVNYLTPTIIHDHSYDIPKDTHNWNLIINKRKNLFDLGMSSALAYVSKNYGGNPALFNYQTVLEEDFFEEWLYVACLKQEYYNLIVTNMSKDWKSIDVIYYEDFINEYNFISKKYGGRDLNKMDMLTYPSLDHKHSVSNYSYLKDKFNTEVINSIVLSAQQEAKILFDKHVGIDYENF